MHSSAMRHMAECIDRYMPTDRHYDLLDFGSFINRGQTNHHGLMLQNHKCSITGVDIQPGRNVDIVMVDPYKIPLASASQDIVISGQVFEHIPFPWISILEIARVLRRGGYFFMTAPSRGHRHSFYDPWRYYPDSMRALAAWADLDLLEGWTDWPPKVEGSRRFDYAAIDSVNEYWGDTVGVFRKPEAKPRLRHALMARVVHEILVRRGNSIRDLEGVPRAPRPSGKPRGARHTSAS